MSFLKPFYYYFLYHQRDYERLLKETNFNITKDIQLIDDDKLRYQGLCSYHKGNFHHSQMCFELLLEKQSISSMDCCYLASLYSRRNEREKTLSILCKALEINSGNRYAKKSLDYIRQNSQAINFSDEVFFEKNLPGEPFILPIKQIAFILVIILILSLLGLGGKILYQTVIKNYMIKKSLNNRLNTVMIPDFNPNLIDKPKIPEESYSYSEREVVQKFNRVKQLILDEKPVDAQVLINQLLFSNASSAVKGKLLILQDFINEPDYSTFKNTITLDQVISNPRLYQNVYILWEGRVVNVDIQKEQIRFNLIIGDETLGIISGIIPVVYKKGSVIKNNDYFYVFGKLKTDSKVTIESYYLIKKSSSAPLPKKQL